MKFTKTNPGEIHLKEKRKELSSLVRQTVKINQRKRAGITWDFCSNGTYNLCGHISLGKEGNIITVYTPGSEAKKNSMAFNAVEVYLLDDNYERLAYLICNRLLDSGYEVAVGKDSDNRIRWR
jgi:hypothetical protein